MTVFHMVVWIVAIVMIANVLTARYKYRGSMGGDGLDDDDRDRLSRLDELEERVQVLEKIVTDRNYDLKREIDDLDRVS